MHKCNKKRLFVALVLCFSILLSFSGLPAQGATDPLSAYQQKQQQINKELKDLKADVKAKDKELKNFQSQLKDVDYSIDAGEKELAAVKEQLAVAQQQLAVTNKELGKAQDSLSTQLTAFESRLRESYMNGDVNIIDVLFDSTSMEDFISRSYYMEKILQYDSEMIGKINERIDDIQEKKAEREQKTQTLSKLKEEQQQTLNRLADNRKEKAALVASAEEDKELSEQAYKEMEQASNEVAAEIRRIQAANAANGTGGEGTGIYRWPISSSYTRISSPYGMRKHPTTGKYKMHTGIDIPAPAGTPIYAADSGLVIMAKNNGAYGNCVIIDHGSNIATLYGHMSRIGTSNGATVKRGDVIGYVGTTGWSTGNHLHFEVRKNGSHVSPWNYVSKP